MKRLWFFIIAAGLIAAGLLAGFPQPAAGQDTSVTPTATPSPTAARHPATACMDDLLAAASARDAPPANVAPTANEVHTALSVEIVNGAPRLRGVITLRTGETNPLIETLRRRTPGQPEYRDTLIDILSAKSGIGPFGRGRATGMVDSLREPPQLALDGNVATLTFLLPNDSPILAYSDAAPIPIDPWYVYTAGRDLIVRIEGDAIPPDTTWLVATCFDGLSVVSVGSAEEPGSLPTPTPAPEPASSSGLDSFTPTTAAPYLMPVANDGPNRLLWSLSAATPDGELIVAPRVRPDVLTEFRLWLFTDWRWPLAAAWEYAGQFLIVLVPLGILRALPNTAESGGLLATLRRFRIASAAILVLLTVGLVTTGIRAVLLLESPDRPALSSISPASVPQGKAAEITVNGANFVEGARVRLDATDVVTTFVDSTRLSADLTASDLAASGERQLSVIIPPNGIETNRISLHVAGARENPPPRLDSIDPGTIMSGGSAGEGTVVLTAHGRGFVPESVLLLDDRQLPTTFADESQLSTTLTAADLAPGNARRVAVFSPEPGGGESNALPLRIEAGPACLDQLQASLPGQVSPRWLDGSWASWRNTGIVAAIVASFGVFALAARWQRDQPRRDGATGETALAEGVVAATTPRWPRFRGAGHWRDWLPGVTAVLAAMLVLLLGRTGWPLGILAAIVPFLAAGILIYGIIQMTLALAPAAPGSRALPWLSGPWLLLLVVLVTAAVVLQWASWASYRSVTLWAWLNLSEDPLWARWGLFSNPCAALVALSDPDTTLGKFAGNLGPPFINFPESLLVASSRLLPFVVLVGVIGVLGALGHLNRFPTPIAPPRARWAIAFLFGAFVVGYGSVLGFQFPVRLWLAMFLMLILLLPAPTAGPTGAARPANPLPPSVQSPDPNLGPRGDWWANGVLAAQRGAGLAIVPVAYYLYVLATADADQYVSRQVAFGVVALLVGLASELAFWIVAAFTLGSLYPLLRGQTGPLKALLLTAIFVGAYLPSLLRPEATQYPWLVRAFQLALFLIVLGVWFDMDTRQIKLNLESLAELYHFKDVKTAASYVAPAVALIGTVVSQLRSGDAAHAILEIANHLATQLPTP